MQIKVDYRVEVIKLLRSHQEELAMYDVEAEMRRQRLSFRHFRTLDNLGDEVSYVKKALIIRKQYLQMQRFKTRLKQKRLELLLKQAQQLKELKLLWAKEKIGD